MSANPVDQHVGERIRKRRVLLGLSQQQFAAALGLSFQQVQKYEKGENRLGASRLFDAARILAVPISYFFADMPKPVLQSSVATIPEHGSFSLQSADTSDSSVFARRETLEFVRAYYRIKDEDVRNRVLALARAMGS